MPFAELENISLYFEEHGAGPTVLFLPELGGSTRTWRHVVGPLSQNYHLVLPDIRGTGLSEKPLGGYSMEVIVDDILRFIKQRKLGPLHLIGCAMGSIVSLELTLQSPGTVRSLVLCSVSPDIPGRTKIYAGQRARDVRERGMRAVSRTSTVNSFPVGTELPVEQARAEYEANFLANDPIAYAALSEALLAWENRGRLADIRCPCLCLAGDKDFMWDPATVEATARHLPGATFECIENAGHFPPLSAPKSFANRVRAFLNSMEA